MRLPVTLSLYIGRQFLFMIAMAFAGMLTVVILGDLVELIRRTADSTGGTSVSLGTVLEMVLLKAPDSGIAILPFSVLVGGMLALSRLTRTHELVVARAAGVSVWQFLMPAIILVLGIGIFFVTVFNPVSAAMLSRFQQIEAKYITGKTSLLSVSSSGLWIRQVEQNDPQVREHVFHALKVTQKGMTLSDVIVFSFGDNNKFIGRMDARSATLEEHHWHLHDVTITKPGPAELPVQQDDVLLQTDLTTGQIQDSFAEPKTLSFWQLPAFIHTLEAAGFSALRHRMYWQGTLASPFLLCAMILIAAVFSLRLPRRGGVVMLIVVGVITGFFVFFMTNFISAFGQSGEMPVTLAAWAPSMIALMIGGGMLLHLEDG
jgi:lipopolysaccharide export system permease protein